MLENVVSFKCHPAYLRVESIMSENLPSRSRKILESQLELAGVTSSEVADLPTTYLEAMYINPFSQFEAANLLLVDFFDRVANRDYVPLSRTDNATFKMMLKIGRGSKRIKPLSDYAHGVIELHNHLGYMGLTYSGDSRLAGKASKKVHAHRLFDLSSTLSDLDIDYVDSYLRILELTFRVAENVGEKEYRPTASVFSHGIGERTWLSFAEPHMRLLKASKKSAAKPSA